MSPTDRDTNDTESESQRNEGKTPIGDNQKNENNDWKVAEIPTKKALHGVVETKVGPLAVGESGKVLLRSNEEWKLVISDGPGAKRNPLTDVSVSADGERVWFCGGSGALGCYDVTVARKYDYSAPEGKTSTWEAVAVTGEYGSERLRVANGSGEVLSATLKEGVCPTFETVVKPGGGSTISALTFGDGMCYAVDTSGNAFRETDESWCDIGVKNAQVNFSDIATSVGILYIVGGDGLIYRYDRSCDNWTPTRVAPAALHGVCQSVEYLISVGEGGTVCEHGSREGWVTTEVPTEATLHAVTAGDVDVAVGENGAVIER